MASRRAGRKGKINGTPPAARKSRPEERTVSSPATGPSSETPTGDAGVDFQSLFASLIAHLPAEERKRIPPIVDQLIQARNKALASWNLSIELRRKAVASLDQFVKAQNKSLASLRGGEFPDEVRNAARAADEATDQADAACREMLAAARLLRSLCPIPEEWQHLGEMTGAKSLPPQADNKAVGEALAAFRDFVANRKAAGRRNSPPPLTEPEQEVLDLIAAQPADRGITGKQISNRTGIGQSTLTSHVIPKLKRWYGIKNRRGAGYYRPV
jgi:hypothetical protein